MLQFTKKIDNLIEVTYRLSPYYWGYIVVAESKNLSNPQWLHTFSERRFKFTKNYDTYHSLVERIKSYYKIS